MGFYEGGSSGGTGWTMGLATAPASTGPWTKYAKNPILLGTNACDKNRTFHNLPCNGVYVGAVMHDENFTNGEYWAYLEAPINMNDEGPMALWTADKPEGPFKFKVGYRLQVNI